MAEASCRRVCGTATTIPLRRLGSAVSRSPDSAGSNGTFCTEQRRLPSLADVPVLVVSAQNDLERQAARLGAAGSVTKPYDVDELLKPMKVLTGTQRAA
jgi:CheY-like chemotaxis protein